MTGLLYLLINGDGLTNDDGFTMVDPIPTFAKFTYKRHTEYEYEYDKYNYKRTYLQFNLNVNKKINIENINDEICLHSFYLGALNKESILFVKKDALSSLLSYYNLCITNG